jgi:light-regulated signal transduction histidine kinase (bacteriophytochrome)
MVIAMQNLLENAWKFTGKTEQAVIQVGTVEEDGARNCFVADNGVGFDMTYADRLFGAFQRLHHESEFSGTGIGLAIVQRIFRRHDGRIWVRAKPGQGATFYFNLKEPIHERTQQGHLAG